MAIPSFESVWLPEQSGNYKKSIFIECPSRLLQIRMLYATLKQNFVQHQVKRYSTQSPKYYGTVQHIYKAYKNNKK